MTKQEEIREILEGVSSGGLSVDEGLRELGIVGCVIKVDWGREGALIPFKGLGFQIETLIPISAASLEKAGYGAFEPLIKEETK